MRKLSPVKIIILFAIMVFIVASTAFSQGPEPIVAGIEKRHFDRLKLEPRPALWEDGFRTSLDPGNFEWWYFDAHLDDGTVVVIVFYTRQMIDIDSEAVPTVTVGVTMPDGTEFKDMALAAPEAFQASRSQCDVKIGNSKISGDLKSYRIQVDTGTITCDLTLVGNVPAWRPETGHMFFGEAEEKYFAWLAAVPYGKIEGEISFGGKRRQVKGSGYHDHNWGNILLSKIINNWWWSRAQFGDYTIITSEMITTERYGTKKLPVFLLAKKDKMIMEDGRMMTLKRSEAIIHPESGKPVENKLVFNYTDPGRSVSASYTLDRKKDILIFDLLNAIPRWKAFLARIVGIRPWYHRIQGDATLEIDINGQKESMQTETVYELMYLGRNLSQGKEE